MNTFTQEAKIIVCCVLWSRSNSRYDTVFISRDTCNRDRLLVCTSHILQCTTCATYIRLLLVTRSLWHMVIFELNDLFCLQRDKYNNQLQKNNWSSFATTGLWSDVCCWQIQTTPYSHDKLWCSSFLGTYMSSSSKLTGSDFGHTNSQFTMHGLKTKKLNYRSSSSCSNSQKVASSRLYPPNWCL